MGEREAALLRALAWPSPGPDRIADGLGNAQVFPYALSDETGEEAMHVTQSDDSSSLLVATSQQVEAFPDAVEVDQVTVGVWRLDELIPAADLPHPILVKIDVQGSELDVLRGASGLLAGVRDILAECDWLVSSSRTRDGIPLQCDVLFTRATEGDRASEG